MRFLFLPILRCFSSRRSPLREAIAVGIPIRKSLVLCLRAAPQSLSQLGTSFVGFRAEPFSRWHSSHVSGVSSQNELTASMRLGERVQWTPGSHVHAVSFTRPVQGCVHRPFPSAVARNGASVLRTRIECRAPLKRHDFGRARDMDPLGFEPRASALQRRRSATELWARPPSCVSPGSSLVLGRPSVVFRPSTKGGLSASAQSRSVGGDPGADSPTPTLLRLKPPCEAQIRPPCGGLIRTSLGCFDGRCVQGAGTYSPRAADTRLLPNPAS